MASIRKTKKEVTYLANEIISDCYVALYFQPTEKRDAILEIITKAAAWHNQMIEQINHPAEKHNPSLVRKHYAGLRNEMFQKVDAMFAELSNTCKSK